MEDNQKKINQQVEERYLELNESEKTELIKKDKESVKSTVQGGGLLLMLAVLIALGVIAIFVRQLLTIVVSTCFVAAVLIIGVVGIVIYQKLDKKKTDEQRIKRQLKEEIEKKNDPKYIDYDAIVKVTLVDSYTILSDKLHAILHYKEIIQTRYYKFKIDFNNGISKIITEKEDSETYNKLIYLVGTEKAQVVETEKPQDMTEELRKYKELLDAGVITEEEFEAKKKQILGL